MTDERRAWTIRIPKWADFQHYKDRSPPWLKLYSRTLLDKPEWRRLHGSAAKLLVDLWMLVGTSHDGRSGELTMRLADVAYRLRVDDAELLDDLRVLEAAEFIQLGPALQATRKQRASKAPQNAIPETETETETETESNDGPSGAGIRPPGNWVVEFGSAWKARFQGVVPFKRIGHALKPLRAEYADAEILSRWERYLSRVEGRFASPEDFAKKFGEWGGTAPVGGVSRNAAISRAIDALGVVDDKRIPSHGFPTEAQFAQWLERERERMAS